MSRTGRLWTTIGIVVVAFVVLLAPWKEGWIWQGEKEFEGGEVTAMMPYIKNSEWCGFYAALLPVSTNPGSTSFYEQQGLDVTMEYTSEGGYGAIKLLAAGQADFAYAGADAVLLARAEGLPVVAVYQPEKNNLFGLLVPTDSGITEPADLAGKTIAIIGVGSPATIAAKTILTTAGVNLDDIEFVPMGAGIVGGLAEGQADAAAGYIIHELILRSMGIEHMAWHAQDYAENYGVTSIVTTEEMIEKHPDVVQRFVDATHEGWKIAVADPQGTVDACIEAFYPEGADYRDMEVEYWERLVNEVYEAPRADLGVIYPELWARTHDVLLDLGVLDEAVDVERAYTTRFKSAD